MKFVKDAESGVTRLVMDNGTPIADYSGYPETIGCPGLYEARIYHPFETYVVRTEADARKWISIHSRTILLGLANGGCTGCGRPQPTSGGEVGTWSDWCHDCDEQATYAGRKKVLSQ